MKVFAGGVSTETNTFSPMPTGMRDYTIIRPDDDVEKGTKPAFDQFQAETEARGWDYVFGMSANAQPAGLTTR
ncbi:MAG: M81 family metallopeptidase, partial [Caldilineaceae bacterium]|nr:M81 family metallopeptidase [Caldilineaceae bacterium]